MKQFYSILAVILMVFLMTGCSTEQSDTTSVEKEEVYVTAGLKARPLTDVKFERTPQRIARGEYLVEGASHCFLCHSERDRTKPGAPFVESKKGSGKVLINKKDIRVVAPNITPDMETGAGSWTDDMLARAIREGVGHDGRALYPLMLYYSAFKYFSDEDLESIVVYLRTLPPVKNKLPKRKLPENVQKMIVNYPQPVYKSIPPPDFTNVLERGKYLVEVGDCNGCHTSWETPLKPGLFGGGMFVIGQRDSAYSANLSPDSSGILYDEDTFIAIIKTGKGGTLHTMMPWVAIKNYTDDDLRAIYRYLRTIKPVRHYVNNFSEPTYCKACGQMHGLGNMNTKKMIKTVEVKPAVYNEYAGTYTSLSGDSLTVFRDDDSLKIKDDIEGLTLKLLPVSRTEFASENLPFNIKFLRDRKNKITALSYNLFDDIVCKKVK